MTTNFTISTQWIRVKGLSIKYLLIVAYLMSDNNLDNEDGWIRVPNKFLTNELGLTLSSAQHVITRLREAKLIEVANVGFPQNRWVKVNVEEVAKMLETGKVDI